MRAQLTLSPSSCSAITRTLMTGRPMTLGRGVQADWVIRDGRVSRNHCRVELDGRGRLVIEDLDSLNGTWVDGIRIQRAFLSDGALVQLGNSLVEVAYDPVVSKPAVAAPEERQPYEEKAASTLPLDDLEDFIIRRRVAISSAGPVYEAHHRHMRQDMLLLFLDPARLQDPTAKSRFLLTGRLGARFRHDRFLRILSMDPLGETMFARLQPAAAASLWDRVRRQGPLPVNEAVRMTQEVLDALEQMHQRKVHHGSLTPTRVVQDLDGNTRLSFFDLVFDWDKGLPPAQVDDYFRAPEHLMGTLKEGARTELDLWSVGALLHFGLSGIPPRGKVPPNELNRPLERALPLPDRVLPAGVRQALEQALHPVPERRFKRCAAFREALVA